MNKERRKKIDNIADKLTELESEVEDIMNEEDEYRDNMPENLWESERYEISESCSDSLQEVIDGIEDILSSLEEAKG